MIPIDIQVSRSKVKPIINMLGKGGISVFLYIYIFFLSQHLRYSISLYFYTPRNEVRGGILESPCPSVCLSVRLSVDARLGKMVSSA